MAIYHVIFLLLFLFGFVSLFVNIKKSYSVLIVIVLFLFGALRYKIGMDYESYEMIFDSIKSSPMSLKEVLEMYIEPGYGILISYFKYFGFEKTAYFALLMFISLYYTQKGILKYSTNVYISWIIMFGVYYANLFFNGMRQGLFIAIVLFFFPDLLEKSKKSFLKIVFLSVLLSFCLHKTAIILPFFYFICLYTPSHRNKYIILFFSMLWAFSGAGNIITAIGGLSFVKDVSYLSVVDVYSQHEAFGKEVGFFSISVLHRLLILVLALYFSNFKSASPIFKKITNIYFWGAVIYFVLIPLGYIMATRVSMNLKIFDVVLIPYFIFFLKEYQYKVLGFVLICLWSFAVMLTNFYIPGNYEYYVPYRSIFSK